MLYNLGGLLLLFLAIDYVAPVQTNVAFAPIVEARDGTVLHAYMARDQQWRIKARLDEITPELKKAIVFKEDKHFYHHPGINLLAIGRALINNLFHLKRTSGASTITMQVARLLDPEPGLISISALKCSGRCNWSCITARMNCCSYTLTLFHMVPTYRV